MAISRAQLLKELLPGLNALFGLEYKKYPEEWRQIFDVETSNRSFEEDVKLSGFGLAPVKGEGNTIEYDEANEVWSVRYNHEVVALGFSLTEEAIEDNLYDSLSKRYTKALARSMQETKEIKGANILNNGFTSFTTGDGKALFAEDHPLVSGGTLANEPSTAVDLNETALEDAIITISQWTDERGLLIAAQAQKLVIPPQLQFVAHRIMKSDLRVATADNDTNAMKDMGMISGGMTVNHYLTDPDAWFLKTDVPDGAKHFTRRKMKTGMEGDFDSGNVRYKAHERYSFGVTDYLAFYGSPGA